MAELNKEHLVLAGPFRRQVDEPRNSHAVRESAFYGGLGKMGCQESERATFLIRRSNSSVMLL
jgi:hypothetical protein